MELIWKDWSEWFIAHSLWAIDYGILSVLKPFEMVWLMYEINMGFIWVFYGYYMGIITFTQRLTVEKAPFPNSSFRSYSSLKWPLLDIATP